jgi:3-oxoacyl-[acyl-carrier protein] reductase
MEPVKKLAGKVALVTGAARGLGRAYALHLAKLGADVVVNDVNLKAYEEYGEKIGAGTVMEEIESLGVRALGVETDVTKRDLVNAMFAQVEEKFGRLDILVNNAGGVLRGGDRAWAVSAPKRTSYILDVNLMDTIFCCQAAAPIMKRSVRAKS